jgi:dipeptidyl aminopeptidase/acylaminoacyl peptidase
VHRTIRFGLLATVAAIGAVSVAVRAQTGFSLAQITSYAFPSDMVASPTGSAVAWITTQRGVRNVWIAQGPDFSPRALTDATADDGQELTNLSFSGDGRFVVYTRGGDHGSNWPSEGNLQPDPTSSPVQPVIEVWAAPAAGGEPKRLAEGDDPVPSPDGSRVVFERARQLWVVPTDGSKPAERLFFARGSSGSPEWSPDGRLLAFVSNRGDHSFIAIYSGADEPLRYLTPSTARDSMPRWSPDGRRLAFVRRPGQGGPAGPLLDARPQPWAIWVAEVDTGKAREIWHSPATLRGSYPRTQGGANLNWAAGDRLVYLSYEDGWPHLYSVPAAGGSPVNLTSGSFIVEYVTMAADRRSVVYNANTGDAAGDIDRRHLFKVPVDRPAPVALTRGDTIDWAPVVTADNATVAFFGATPRQPGQPMVMPLTGGTPRALAGSLQPAEFPAAALVVPEPVTFQAPDGTTVHAQLFKSATGAARRPAVVFVHGGPPRQMLLGWHYMYYYANSYAVNQYLASRGFIVLSVNYRLGIGYGYEFHQPERAGARGASEYQDVLAGGRYLQQRPDVDASRIGIWGGSYGGYLTALALGRNSDVFAAGVDLHGVHTRVSPIDLDLLTAGIVGDGVTETDVKEALRVAWSSSPVSAVPTWRSPVLLIHGDDDRNVQFAQTVDLVQRLRAKGVEFEEIVLPDEIHDFLLYRTWLNADEATADFLERKLR